MAFISQSYFIPAPTLTEKNLPDQAGRVHIVTGGYAGVGFELVKILYGKHATVYVAGRSQEKATKAISTAQKEFPDSKGKLAFMNVDLSNLATIKPGVEDFFSKESRLDVLTNNAGVMTPPRDSLDAHGHELQMGTNCLGPFLLTQLLLPILQKTAESSPVGSVRVTWAASIAADLFSATHGVDLDASGAPVTPKKTEMNYGNTKAGNCLLAAEFALRYGKGKAPVYSVSWNPGNLRSELQRHMPSFGAWLLNFGLHPTKMGAYTELWAACAEGVDEGTNGCFVAPWGRVERVNDGLTRGMRRVEEGGTGTGMKFWEWCEKETKEFA
ncbi:NAD(P)-binding protein [Aulographum hederae CBS 113979]|uniref:NAD(P)-binding protein n=1 Tax=Aulographum hederae CBS 113979 TaxID=1176131 RepID=A0A6G1GZK0_9PEZI|nr:NAD(P)-binding protein [Aulographum hederae CBS 113979]